ncbi:MAG: hypothetical protein WC578_03620 [Candidatus Omnitrophota bacterium]
MKLIISLISFLVFAVSSVWAGGTTTDATLKNTVIYIQSSTPLIKLQPESSGILEKYPSKGKEKISQSYGLITETPKNSVESLFPVSGVKVDALSEFLAAFDGIFEKYENVAKKSRIKTVELGVSTTAEGKLYIVSGQATSSIKIVLERKE